MTVKSLRFFVLICGISALAAGCESMRSESPEWDGLTRRWDTRLNRLFVKPDAAFEQYHSVMLDPVQVSFQRNWSRGPGPGARLSAQEVARIQETIARMVRDTFIRELTEAGYQIVEQPGDETLRVTAAVVDVFISAPDTLAPGRNTTYTADPGRATLVLELRDSVTGEILARAVDSRTGRNAGVWTITNRVTNSADAQRAINTWASGLREAIGEVYAAPES